MWESGAQDILWGRRWDSPVLTSMKTLPLTRTYELQEGHGTRHMSGTATITLIILANADGVYLVLGTVATRYPLNSPCALDAMTSVFKLRKWRHPERKATFSQSPS